MRYPFLDLAEIHASSMELFADAASRVVRSGRYIGGPEVEEFERNLARICQTTYAIGVSNGLDALKLILRAYMEMGHMAPGDEIIVAANTYIASVLAISEAGLTPVLVEPNGETFNIDSANIEAAITPRTRGIMTVHLFGRPSWDKQMVEIANRYNLKIIEDNAQAIGAQTRTPGLNNTHTTGGLGHAAGISFYPTKNIGAMGDAGAVTTNDPELAAVVRALANYGSDRRYHNIYRGFNCRLDPIQAAILNLKFPALPLEIGHRSVLADIYNKKIKNPQIILPHPIEGHVYHQYVIRTVARKEFLEYLDANGVGWDIHYPTPPHLQPCYRRMFAGQSFPVTEQIANQCVSLPISRCTSPSDAAAIAQIISQWECPSIP